MARGKKAAKELSPEEKLQQALVPVKEQPYQISENWCWIILGNAVDIKRGASPRPIKSYITDELSGVNWIKIGDTDTGKYVTSVKEKITRQGANKSVFVEKGTLLLSNIMSFGRPYILNVEGCIHDGWLAITPSDCFDKEFLYYTLLASNWYFEQVAVGTAVRNLNSERVANTPVPLPPLPEQHRIVSRIESLFAKLGEAKEKAQAVVDGFELRKSAILHKAFTGELTERWRKEHGVGLESWKRCLIGEVFDLQAGKNISAKEISSQQTDLYRYPCFGGNGIRGYVEQFNCEGEHPIIGRQGALCGNINLANNQFYATEHAVVVSYKMDVSTPWAYHYLKFLDLNQYATATAQPGLAVSNIVKVPIQYIPFEEQQELSRILDTLLNKEQQAKEAAEAVLSQIDTMKKAILARAFRGELGTNDPAEESAAELIKTVL